MVGFRGTVSDSDGVDQFRIVDGDRLMWSSPETTWDVKPQRFAGAIKRRIATIWPRLGPVEIEDVWSGVYGRTVHGMPQVGQLRPGLWVTSGFGRQGLNTTAMGGLLIARGMLWGDDRWKLFAPFELVWAGGIGGRVVGQAALSWSRLRAAGAGALSRYREQTRLQTQAREIRVAAANRQVQARVQATARRAPPGRGPAPRPPAPPRPDMNEGDRTST